MTAGAARIAIVTVSDRASRGEYEDKGGPGAEAWLRGVITSPMTIDRHIIPDGRESVAATLRDLADGGADLILVTGAYEWTERVFGLGARSIALIDAAAQSPLAQVSMIPLLTLIAVNAPPGHRATWFALMASLMNLALVAGSLQTKYLNLIFPVDRGQYGELTMLVVVVFAIGLIVPLAAILALGHRLTRRPQ